MKINYEAWHETQNDSNDVDDDKYNDEYNDENDDIVKNNHQNSDAEIKLREQRFQRVKFSLLKKLFKKGKNLMNSAISDVINTKSPNHINALVILLCYFTGFRYGCLIWCYILVFGKFF